MFELNTGVRETNSYRQLQMIYEDGYRGDITNFPNKIYGATQGPHSYSKDGLPGMTPGQGQPSTYSVAIPEEEEDDTKMISRSVVVNKINELIADAEDKGCGYEQLYDLIVFLKQQ